MAKKSAAPAAYVQPYRYPWPNIPLAASRRFARKIAQRFHPEKIVLFGSYAYGQPHPDSDVDLLVVIPTRNEIDESIRMWNAVDPPFPLDIIVRKIGAGTRQPAALARVRICSLPRCRTPIHSLVVSHAGVMEPCLDRKPNQPEI